MSEQPSLRVVFRGEIVEGFDRDAVKRVAAERLGASPAQIEQVFGGQPVVLKKGLDAVTGERYVALLARIGMRATLLPMPPASAAAAAVAAPQAAPAAPQQTAAEPPRAESAPASPATSPAPFDPEATHLTHVATMGHGDTDPASDAAPPDPGATQLYVPREAPPYTCPRCGTSQVRRSRCWQCGHPTDAPWPPVEAPAEVPRPRVSVPVVAAESTIAAAEPTVIVPLDRPADAPVPPVTEMGLLAPSAPAPRPARQSRTMVWLVLATLALVGGLMWYAAG